MAGATQRIVIHRAKEEGDFIAPFKSHLHDDPSEIIKILRCQEVRLTSLSSDAAARETPQVRIPGDG